MTRAASIVLVVLFVAPIAARTAPADEPAAPTVAADVTADTTWKGTVRLDGRVHVRRGATLRIAPGTHVVVVPVAAAAENPALRFVPGIEVEGSLVAEGAADAPITFEPEAPAPPAPPDPKQPKEPKEPKEPKKQEPLYVWLGILVPPAERGAGGPAPGPVVLSRCVIRRALAGVQAARTDVSLRSCVFHQCAAGVAVGEAWDSEDRFIAWGGDDAPQIRDCRFGSCGIGLGVEGLGRPEVDRCLFASCRLGLGNQSTFTTVYPIWRLGPRAKRCEFVRCGTAVLGTSFVTDSIFEGNDLVYAASDFHEITTSKIDRFVRSNDLYGPGQRLTRSDVPLGEHAILEAPRRRGRLPEAPGADVLGGDLAPLLGLARGSPGLGAATDGGDVGMFGDVGAKRPDAATGAESAGLSIRTWLIAGPAPLGMPTSLASLAKAVGAHPRRAGDLDGPLEWAVAPGEALADLAPATALLGNASAPRVLCAVLASGREGGCTLRFAWDGVLEASWNGVTLSLPEGSRRFRPADASVDVARVKGDNVLLLRHVPRSTTSRLSVRFVDLLGGGGAPADLEAAPLVRAASAPPTTIKNASWQAPRPAAGKPAPSPSPFLRILLSSGLHWCDAAAARNYAIVDSAGRPVDLLGATIAYRPREGSADLTPSVPLAKGTYTVTLSRMRPPDGSAALEPLSATFRVP